MTKFKELQQKQFKQFHNKNFKFVANGELLACLLFFYVQELFSMQEVLELLKKKSPISIGDYVEFCLFDDDFGYYKKDIIRTGKEGDFYTSQTLNPKLFSQLILEAFLNLTSQKYQNLAEFKIVEIGAEPNKNLFKSSKVIGVKDELILPEKVLVFSNELLDARPFERFVFKNKKIFKTFVDFSRTNCEPVQILNDVSDVEFEILRKYFPEENLEDFVLDFSIDALNLLKNIVSQKWIGAMIFIDYFRSKNELLEFKKGTARIYKNHKTSTDIFYTPSFCDITFSPLDKPFLDILKENSFSVVEEKSQADFFMNFAQNKIREIVEKADVLSSEKRALMEFLAPQHLGEFFRVIYAVR